MLRVVSSLLVLVYAVKAIDFSYTECTPPGSPLVLNRLSIDPDPVVLPGPLHLTLDGSLTEPVYNSSMALTLKRKTFLGEIPIPCVFNVGSCTYPNLCTIVDDMEREDWAGIAAGIGHQLRKTLTAAGVDLHACPQPAQRLLLNPATLQLPAMPSIISWFAAGDYHLHVLVTETMTSKTILCMDAVFSMKEQCSGLGCFIGK